MSTCTNGTTPISATCSILTGYTPSQNIKALINYSDDYSGVNSLATKEITPESHDMALALIEGQTVYYSLSLQSATNGTRTVELTVCDKALNCVSATDTIILDTVRPTISQTLETKQHVVGDV